MTIGSGAWADRIDALLTEEAGENILIVILLAVPRSVPLQLPTPVTTRPRRRLKPVWDRFSPPSDLGGAELRAQAEADHLQYALAAERVTSA